MSVKAFVLAGSIAGGILAFLVGDIAVMALAGLALFLFAASQLIVQLKPDYNSWQAGFAAGLATSTIVLSLTALIGGILGVTTHLFALLV